MAQAQHGTWYRVQLSMLGEQETPEREVKPLIAHLAELDPKLGERRARRRARSTR